MTVISRPTNDITQRLLLIDVLRAVAILIVVVFHCIIYIFKEFYLPFKDNWVDFAAAPSKLYLLLYPTFWGWAAVRLFFVLSGFSIHYSALKSLDYNFPLTKQFLLPYAFRRFFRIYPPYLFVCLVVAALYNADLGNTIFHLLLIHNFYEPYFFSINPAFWSIAVEAQFYLLYPLFLLLRNRYGIEKTVSFLFMLSGASMLLFHFLDPPPVSYSLWTSPLVSWVEWGAGALVAERYLFNKPMPPVKPVIIWLVALLFASTQLFQPIAFLSVWTVSGLSALVLWNYLPKKRTLSLPLRFLLLIGTVSYSIYLFHQPLIPFFFDFMRRATAGNMLIQIFLGIPAFALLLTGAGWIFYQIIELPYMQYGKNLLNKKEA